MRTLSFRPDPQAWLASLGEIAEVESGGRWAQGRPAATVTAAGAPTVSMLRLVGGEQPLEASSRDGSCTVIFDGVLHNGRELRARLAAGSHETTDAELVLQGYRSWGEGVLSRIKGWFAVMIWDAAREVLLCARDPLGVYPLFYAHAGREMLFSTSTETLVRHPSVSGAPDRVALARHLCHDWLGPEETYFTAVRRVPPGHAMRVERRDHRVYRYWDPAPLGVPMRWVGEEELERFEGLLDQAVGRCLRLGSAGIQLSGGLDSTTVAMVAADHSRRAGLPPPLALSIVLADPNTNEEVIQKRVSADLGLPQTLLSFEEIVGPAGMLASAVELSRRWPWPVAHPGIAPFHNLIREGKRRGCLVIMTGNGGDEWLTFSPLYTADLLRSWDIAGLCQLLGVAQRSYPISRLAATRRLLWRYGVRPLLATAVHRLAPDALSAHRRRHLSRSTPDWLAPDSSLKRELDRGFQRSVELSVRQPEPEALYLRGLRRLLEKELEDDFEVARRLGVRVLHPFWDADLVDFLYRTPPVLLNRGGRTKALVRKTLADRFPSLGFEQQRKLALFTFYKDRVVSEGSAAWRRMGGVPSLSELGLVDASSLRANLTAIFSGRLPQQFPRIWDTLSVEAWLRPRLR